MGPAPLLAPLLALLVLGVAVLVLAVQRSSQRRLVGRAIDRVARPEPHILYFTGANCTVCHVAQRPALTRLRDQLAGLHVREVDVAAEPQTARRYRVMTLPTTVVVDGAGRVCAVNTGFASEGLLRSQIEAARRLAATAVSA